MVGPSLRLWRALFAMCVALAAFAATGRASASTEGSAADAVLAMSYRIAPLSALPAPQKPTDAPLEGVDGVAFRCDARGAITVAPTVRLEFRMATLVAAADDCVVRCEGGAWEGPHERPTPPPVGENFAATFGAFPRVIAASWALQVPAEASGLGHGANRMRGLDRPPR